MAVHEIQALLYVLGDKDKAQHAKYDRDDRCWYVGKVKVENLGDGNFSVDGRKVVDEDLGKLLSFRFEFDEGVRRAVAELVQSV